MRRDSALMEIKTKVRSKKRSKSRDSKRARFFPLPARDLLQKYQLDVTASLKKQKEASDEKNDNMKDEKRLIGFLLTGSTIFDSAVAPS